MKQADGREIIEVGSLRLGLEDRPPINGASLGFIRVLPRDSRQASAGRNPKRVRKNGVYLRTAFFQYLTSLYGPVAQLIERVVRNDEVVGLIPIRSTIRRTWFERRNAGRAWLFPLSSGFASISANPIPSADLQSILRHTHAVQGVTS